MKVFISYSRTDARPADTVRGWLADAGHEVFLDRDVDDGIRLGKDWQASGCGRRTRSSAW